MNPDVFEKLLEIGTALSSVHDLDLLLDKILSYAQVLTNADGASIYLIENNKLVFKVSRNNTFFKQWGEAKTRETFKSFELPITKESLSGYVAITAHPLNIKDVGQLPPESDYHYDPTFDKKYNYKAVSMLVIPMLDNEDKVIGVLQLINAMEGEKIIPFTDEHVKITCSLSSQAAVAIQNTKFAGQLKEAHYDTILRLSIASAYRDKETTNHIKRVAEYCRLLANKVGFSKEDTEILFWASPMHDIGKLGVPDAILQKPGILTPEERKTMEKHTIMGAMVLKDSKAKVLVTSRIIALTHHEKYDGTGYPQGLKGNEIPAEGRMVAIADVYDALSSKRCYKEAMPDQEVLKILNDGRGKHFDPDMLDMFIAYIQEAKKIKEFYSDTDKDFDKLSSLGEINLMELLKND